jgi:hypothetical protein
MKSTEKACCSLEYMQFMLYERTSLCISHRFVCSFIAGTLQSYTADTSLKLPYSVLRNIDLYRIEKYFELLHAGVSFYCDSFRLLQ